MDEKTTFEQYEKWKKGAAAKKARGPVRHMTIKPVAGGFVSEAEHEDMSNGQETYLSFGMNRTKKHHKDPHELASHISKTFGGRQMVPVGEEAEEESEAAGAGKPNSDEDKD